MSVRLYTDRYNPRDPINTRRERSRVRTIRQRTFQQPSPNIVGDIPAFVDMRGAGLFDAFGSRIQFPSASALGVGSASATAQLIASITGIVAAADPMARLIELMGFGTEPDYLWSGLEASGATELGGSGFNLADASTPVKSVADAVLRCNVTQMNSSADSMVAASATPGNATTHIAVLWIGRLDSGANRGLIGKRTTPGTSAGYELIEEASNTFQFHVGNGTASSLRAVSVDHGTANAQVVLASSIVGGNTALYTREGNSVGTGLASGSMSNAVNFSFGTQRFASANARHALGAVWTGSAAVAALQAAGNTPRLTLAQNLGFE